jgi:hypothetical protein
MNLEQELTRALAANGGSWTLAIEEVQKILDAELGALRDRDECHIARIRALEAGNRELREELGGKDWA